ncbi:hypothetical protein [Leucobacter luti]|uniref:hypothetical protein n=1 Tax=Leucobacter luti TaxID=340320 RepID=UPI003D081885
MPEAYVPRNYTAQVMHGIAEAVAAAGLAVYRPTGVYLPGERGIYFDHSPPLPDTTPEETFVITPYLPQSGDVWVEHTRVQLRARHVNRHPLWVRDFLDDVRALFPERTPLMFGGHLFDRATQASSTTWGEEDRPTVLETTQNIRLRGNRYAP